MQQIPEIKIGIVLYHSPHYDLQPYFYPFFNSLCLQTYTDFEIDILDNGSPDTSYIKDLKKKYRSLHIVYSLKNKGFGGGHNILISKSKSPYYLVLNPDMLLTKDFLWYLMQTMKEKKDAALVTGKIYQWDFYTHQRTGGKNDGKTNIIDTVGIGLTKQHRFFDIAQGRKDKGQYNDVQEIFGASGVCMLLKRDALENIKYEHEYFDENIFMYKEDIDLCYRLQWAGYKAYYTPKAIAYHDRSVSQNKQKSIQVQKWSYLHEKIVLYKNVYHRFPFFIQWGTILRQWCRKVYAFFFARYLWEEEKRFTLLLPKMIKKRKHIKQMKDPRQIISFM